MVADRKHRCIDCGYCTAALNRRSPWQWYCERYGCSIESVTYERGCNWFATCDQVEEDRFASKSW